MSDRERKIKSGHSKGRMLTTRQERFVQELIKGKSQREAYRTAYPKSEAWKDKTVDEAASRLFKNSKVSARYEELQKEVNKKVTWDAAQVKNIIIETMMAAITADVKNGEVDGKAVKSKRYDRNGKAVYEYIDKIDASKLVIGLMGIEAVQEDSGVHIHLHSSEEYDG